MPRAAVLLSGGAPNGALMAGALAGIYDSGKTFNEFYTSGGGGMIGLTYVAGKGMDPKTALLQLLSAGVDDAIYEWVPFGYKTFHKSGPFTVPMKEWADHLRFADSNSRGRRIYNDLVDLVVATLTPTNLTPSSEALCAHYPFVHQLIDFRKLRRFPGEFHMNAYCIETGTMEAFHRDEIGPDHFYASLSFPFIYPPTRIKNRHYYEGAAHDPLNLPRYHQYCCDRGIDLLVVIDILSPYRKALIRRPRNLLDAYGISIMMPVVALATKDLTAFMKTHAQRRQAQRAGRGGPVYTLRHMRFNVAKHDYPRFCDWSYSNLQRLWDIGYNAGFSFAKRFANELPNHAPGSPDPV